MIIISVRRRAALILVSIAIFCNIAVRSWTSTILAPLTLRTYTTGPTAIFEKIPWPLSATASLSPFYIDESKLVRCIFQTNNTQEVYITLKQVLESKSMNVSLSSETTIGGNQYLDADNNVSFSHLSLNASAAILRRMAHISVLESRMKVAQNFKFNDKKQSDISSTHLMKIMISDLLEVIRKKLMSYPLYSLPSLQYTKKMNNEQSTLPGLYSLSDILQALALLSHNSLSKEKMRPFAICVVEYINIHPLLDLHKLGPIRLVQCLQAMAKLDIDDNLLMHSIFKRLLKPDAVSKLPAKFLAHGLASLAIFQSTKRKKTKALHKNNVRYAYISSSDTYDDVDEQNSNDDVINYNNTVKLSKAFIRRLRKRKVAQEGSMEDMRRGLAAARDLSNLGLMTNIEEEASKLAHTGIYSIIEKKKSLLTPSLTPTQMIDLISSWATLRDKNREDTIIANLLQTCINDNIIDGCHQGQLERFVLSIRKVNVTSTSRVVYLKVGKRFLTMVKENQDSNYIRPRSANEILRWSAIVHRRSGEVMEPFIAAALVLFSDKSFLERSTVEEIANFLWFLSKTHCFDERMLLNIGKILVRTEILKQHCSPRIVCKILKAFTSIVSLREESLSESLMDVMQDMFYRYGKYLLSSSLSPAEASSALYAYARANYIRDMRVFGHLVNLMASSRQSCSSRQLSQTLWSCGKMMITWERRQKMRVPRENNPQKEIPSYVDNALTIVIELSTRVEELSSADIAQIIWALGRLEIREERLASQFADRAVDICSSMNSIEVSNVLWGIVRVQYKDRKLIGSLSTRLLNINDADISPRVAASVLYSMGKLCWKDEILFNKLSRTMINQIEDVNAQSVANTLWAFQAIRLRAPRELLNIWATTRLGIVPATSVRSNKEPIIDSNVDTH